MLGAQPALSITKAFTSSNLSFAEPAYGFNLSDGKLFIESNSGSDIAPITLTKETLNRYKPTFGPVTTTAVALFIPKFPFGIVTPQANNQTSGHSLSFRDSSSQLEGLSKAASKPIGTLSTTSKCEHWSEGVVNVKGAVIFMNFSPQHTDMPLHTIAIGLCGKLQSVEGLSVTVKDLLHYTANDSFVL
ncbi:hypothetical protein BDF14DRAFT_1886974 [Spinellus fusiger]|nr:hypothetical protein BDF14DRAFT_1886974 [Spinellus fusiger]